MGEEAVKLASTKKEIQTFVKFLLNDVQALKYMIENDLFETDVIRIGAEQELCLIDKNFKPAPHNLKVLESINHELFTTELAKFNLEYNLEPLVFEKDCLSKMTKSIKDKYKTVSKHAAKFDLDIILTGILATIRKSDMDLENLTPVDRYKALMTAITNMRGTDYELRLRGVDELIIKQDSPMLESCNTGFQVHLQVTPDTFAQMYNIAQAVTGPVMAIAVNSPMLFGKRLWAETRTALFQQSVDTRKHGDHFREQSPRVTFGKSWLKKSILEIYQDDIARHRVLLSSNEQLDAIKQLENGEIPELKCLQVHNSTVYRWNRPCYGVGGGKPHLRIENRILPAGPTIDDEMANGAFWLGLMVGVNEVHGDITKKLSFDDALNNFVYAARTGMDTKMTWFKGKRYNVADLIRKELLPLAKEGLKKQKIVKKDIDKFLGIIEDRAKTSMTGSRWVMESFAGMSKSGTRDEVVTAITAATVNRQKEDLPVHKWKLATFEDLSEWTPTNLLVEEFMTTDLFSVQPTDIVELVVDLMDWNKIRYMPVEDEGGHLVGLITSRILLREIRKKHPSKSKKPIAVESIMIKNPITIKPNQSIMDAMNIMDENQIGCIPVVKDGRLVGIITEQDFLQISSRLIRRLASKKTK